eukprot:gene8272-17021_t
MGNFCSICPQSLEQEQRYARLNNEKVTLLTSESESTELLRSTNSSSNSSEEVDVLVIGAGLSGLSAAQYILKKNPKLTVRIVEARNRPGGRTHSISSACLPEVNIDVGGQWIGPGQHRMLKLVEEFKLDLLEQKFSDFIHTQDRLIECANYSFPPLSDEEHEEIKLFIIFIEETIKKIDIYEPWTLENAAELDSMSVADYAQKHMKTVGAQLEVYMFVQSLLACDPDTCSLFFVLYNIASGGGMVSLCDGTSGAQKWRVKNGTQQISDRMVDSLISHGIPCQFNTIVTKLQTHEDPIGINSHCIVNIENENGSKENIASVKAKHVIIAMSPLLAVQKIKFEPELPPGKKAFCESILMGKCVKIIVAYAAPFWEENNPIPVVQRVGINDIGYIHNLYLGAIGKYPALIGLITGSAATTYSALSPEQRKKAIFTQFSIMYHCDISVVSQPLEFSETDWCADSYSAGCFAGIFPPGVLSTYGPDMRSITRGVLHWAGTETAAVYYGYMEGAVLSGERTAIEILQSFEKSNKRVFIG